uniref:Uncharacterized protein n=1 Tax=Arundo donax TaxID=35708 RepID=A0A0A9TMW7_ARUDO
MVGMGSWCPQSHFPSAPSSDWACGYLEPNPRVGVLGLSRRLWCSSPALAIGSLRYSPTSTPPPPHRVPLLHLTASTVATVRWPRW